MENKKLRVTPQYIVDEQGKKTAVILDMPTFEKLVDEIEDVYFAAVAECALKFENEFISHDDVKRSLSDA